MNESVLLRCLQSWSTDNPDHCEFSFHTYTPSAGYRCHGSSYHGDVATLAYEGIRCENNVTVAAEDRQRDQLLDRPTARCREETRCKLVD